MYEYGRSRYATLGVYSPLFLSVQVLQQQKRHEIAYK